MSHTYLKPRSLALLTLVTLTSQIFSPLLPLTYALNTTYYVDATNGNDANDGLSDLTPWQTIAHVNTQTFGEGDNILFECGEIWNEELIIKDSGTDGTPVFYGSYGTCDDTNRPLIAGNGTNTITESGSVSYVTLNNLSSSGGKISLLGTASSGTGIIIENSYLTNPGGVCIEQSGDKHITISANSINSCTTGVSVGSSGSISIVSNTFQNIGTGSAIISTPNPEGSRLFISENLFSSISGGAIVFTSNTTISQNTFTGVCSNGENCAVIENSLGVSSGSTISDNIITSVGTGILEGGYQDGIRLTNSANNITISGNTISNAQVAVNLIDASNITVSSNTLFHPRTYAFLVTEENAGAVVGNTFSNNTVLTYNPGYSMVKIDDQADALGSLLTLSSNAYINVYKGKLPIIEQFSNGGNSYSLDKEELTTLDVGATNFTYFGYKNYTSTGTYSGANLLTNGTFSSDITGWTGENVTLTHNSTGGMLRATQGVGATGAIRSNTFSTVSGAVYEVTGVFRNITNTGGSHIEAYIRQSVSPNALYVDRVLDIVSKSSTGTFTTYVTANTTAADAELAFHVSNPSTAIELDSISVRRVTGLTLNPRTNEARLMLNTGSSANDFSCPGGGGCPLQYRDLTDSAVTFPTNINAYGSKIILWRDPNSSFTPTNIQYKPTGSIVPSAGSVPNNQTIDLTWTANNSTTNLLTGSAMTGAFTLTVSATGTYTFTPPPDGTNTYVLNLENDIGHTIYTADVVTSNTPPVTVPAFFTGTEDSLSITGIVTATDINSGGSLSYSLFDPPSISQGSISNFDSNGLVDFAPTANFCGVATFSFRAFDAFGLGSDALNPGIGSVNIICTNDPPVAIDDSFTATGGNSNLIDVLTNETDIDSPYEAQSFFLTGFTLPAHGTLSITGNVFDYAPDAMYVGTDSFLYTMVDQSGELSNTGTVNLTVVPGSNLPPFVAGDTYMQNEDDFTIATLSGYDFNPGDTLTFTTATLPAHGIVTISGNQFTYTPNADYNGADSFTFTASDGALTSSAATINISMTGQPDVPVVTDDAIGVEMSAVVTLNVMANDNDADSPYAPQNLSISGYTLPSHGTLSVVGTGFSYTSDTPYLGTDSFTYSIQDGDGNLSNTGTVTLTITSTNTPPLAYSGSFTTNEDVTYVGMLSGYDADATPLTFQLVSDVSQGVLSVGSTGGIVYTPTTNYNGSDSFTYRVTDGVFTSAAQLMIITVNPTNDAPSAGHDTATGTEDTVLILTGLLLNDSDIDVGDVVTLGSVLTQGSNGVAALSGNTVIIYTPTADTCGMDTITYLAQDQSGALSGTGNITINMICTNDSPTASGSSYSITGNILTNSGFILTGGLAGADIDLDPLTYTLGTGTTNGVLIFNTGGSFSYQPNIGFSGSDSFTFSVTDGILTTGTATVSITVGVNNYNNAPIAYSGSYTTNEDTVLVGTLTGYDIEGTTLTYTIGSGVTQGILSLGSTGGFVYTPTSNYNGTDTFTFRVSDGALTSTYVTGTINITPVNDLPTGVADSVTYAEDVSPSIIPVLANDTDIDGTVASITGLTQPSTGGTVSISGTGVLFTPLANYCSITPITFTYQAVDNSGGLTLSTTGSVTLTCVNDAPISTDDSVSYTEDASPSIIAVLTNDSDVDTGDTLSLTGLTQPSTGGTVSISGTGVLFTPTANYCSVTPITFTYRASDATSTLSNTGTVSVTLMCVNDLPTGITDSVTITEDTPVTLPVLANDTDIDGTVASITGLTQPSTGGTVSISGTGVLFTPTANYCTSNPTTFTYIPVDNAGGTGSSTTVTFTVSCVADSPIAIDDSQTLLEDAPSSLIPILTNDSDVDAGDTLSITGLTQPSTGGTVFISGTGVLFTPLANYCSVTPITFTYRARDLLGNLSNIATGSVTLTCVNDAPSVLSQSITLTGNISSGSTNILTGTLTGSDVEGNSLTFSVVSAINSGALSLSSTGGYIYTPSVGFVGLATFTYTVFDGTATGNTATVSICVVSPSSSVGLPSCAGGQVVTPVPDNPSNGPGGGGGGGSSGGGSASSVALYTQVTSSSNTSPLLLRQLMLGRSAPLDVFATDSPVQTLMNEPFTRLFDTISTVIEASQELTTDSVGSGDNARDIRMYGRTIYNSIIHDEDLDPSEQADNLRDAAERLREYLNPTPNAREYKALKYVIRILTARESIIRSTLDFMDEIL